MEFNKNNLQNNKFTKSIEIHYLGGKVTKFDLV